jgi:galactonate dehydratase
VQLTAKSGFKGHGECGEISAAELEAARKVLIGRPATARESVRQALQDSPRALGAIDTAMLDVVGQHAKAPIFQLLGGPTRNRSRALARLAGTTDEDLV